MTVFAWMLPGIPSLDLAVLPSVASKVRFMHVGDGGKFFVV